MSSTRTVALVVAIAVLALPACKRDTQVSGDVFIVTKGRQNVKLGLVEVKFVPEAAMAPFAAAKMAAANARISEAQPKLQQLLKHVEEAKATHAQLEADYNAKNARWERSPDKYGSKAWRYRDSVVIPARDLSHSASLDLMNHRGALADAVHDALKLTRGHALLAGLPVPTLTAKTDADGKFSLKLPPGKYAVVANTSRLVGGDAGEETYYWAVWLIVNGEAEKHIMLSSDNEIDLTCTDCVFSPSKMKEPLPKVAELTSI